MYEITIEDENEMKWFFDHIIKEEETHIDCLSTYVKKLNEKGWTDFFNISLSKDVKESFPSILYVQRKIREALLETYGKGNFIIIAIVGGYCCLVKENSIESTSKDFINLLYKKADESAFNGEIEFEKIDSHQCVPIPGTLQNGNLVKIINKDDFHDE